MLKVLIGVLALIFTVGTVYADCGIQLPSSNYCSITNASASSQRLTDMSCRLANSDPLAYSFEVFPISAVNVNCSAILNASSFECQNAFIRYYCSTSCVPCQPEPVCNSVCNDLVSSCSALNNAGCLNGLSSVCTTSSTCFEVRTTADTSSSAVSVKNFDFFFGLITFLCSLFFIFH